MLELDTDRRLLVLRRRSSTGRQVPALSLPQFIDRRAFVAPAKADR
jgi:hypothetical protein